VVSQENVERVRERFDAYNRGDTAGLIALTDVSAEWWDRADDPLGATHHRGHDACMRHLAEITGGADLRVEALDYIDADDLVVVPVRLVGTGRTSGTPFDEKEVHVFRLRDGLVIETREYRELPEALKAVGIAE